MSGDLESGPSTGAAKDLPDLVLVFSTPDTDCGLQVYGLGFWGGPDTSDGIIFKLLFSFNRGNVRGMGFAVSGSNLVAVGGPMNKSPNDCLIWDLTDWRNRDVFEPTRKIQTLGEKPYPVVFEYDGWVYALSGLHYTAEDHIPDPVFEACNIARGGKWKRRPNPLFLDEYDKRYPPRFEFHTVIGATLYLGLFDMKRKQQWEYYSYDILKSKWEKINDFDAAHPIVKNFMNHCLSEKIDYVDDDLMVFTSDRNMEVYACDLNSNLEELATPPPVVVEDEEEEEEKKDENPDCGDDAFSEADEIESLDSADLEDYTKNPTPKPGDYQFSSDDNNDSDGYLPFQPDLSYAYLPVRGLEGEKQGFPDSLPNNQLVAHLRGDMYCAVFSYLRFREENPEGQNIHIITFSAVKQPKGKRCIKANVLGRAPYTADMVFNLVAWCKSSSESALKKPPRISSKKKALKNI